MENRYNYNNLLHLFIQELSAENSSVYNRCSSPWLSMKIAKGKDPRRVNTELHSSWSRIYLGS